MAASIRRGEFQPALSGSLFQAVVAFAVQRDEAMIAKTYVGPSSELTEIYRLADPPRTVRPPQGEDAEHGDDPSER